MKLILLFIPLILFAKIDNVEEQILASIKAKQLKNIVDKKVGENTNNINKSQDNTEKEDKNKDIVELNKKKEIGFEQIITNTVYHDEYLKDILIKLVSNIEKTTFLLKYIYEKDNSFFKKYMEISRLINKNGSLYDGFRYYDTAFYLKHKKTFDIYNRLSLLLLQKYDYYLKRNINVDNQLDMLTELTKLIKDINYNDK
jgi:hypothetical protein